MLSDPVAQGLENSAGISHDLIAISSSPRYILSGVPFVGGYAPHQNPTSQFFEGVSGPEPLIIRRWGPW